MHKGNLSPRYKCPSVNSVPGAPATREGGPQNFWVPSAAIATVSRRTKSLFGTPLPVTHPWLVEMPYSRRDCFWRGRTCYHPFVHAIGSHLLPPVPVTDEIWPAR